MIKQLSVFIPNQTGTLARLTKCLQEYNIDIRAITVFDTTEFGILRMIASDPDRAVDLLNKEGFVAQISRIIAVEPRDVTGSLHEMFSILAEQDISIEYVYSFVMRQGEMPYFVLKVNDTQKAVDVLTENNFKVVNKAEVYGTGTGSKGE